MDADVIHLALLVASYLFLGAVGLCLLCGLLWVGLNIWVQLPWSADWKIGHGIHVPTEMEKRGL